MHAVRPVLALLVAAAALATACDQPPSADRLAEWKPADHDRREENSNPKLQAGSIGSAAPKNQPQSAAQQAATLVEVTWQNQCASCHGTIGHGDGPQGPMVKARDLTAEQWQAAVTDDQIVSAIKNGKNKMPKFDLPDAVVKGLVARIRATRGR